MEFVGLGLSIASLAGMFTTVCDAMDRVGAYRHFEIDSKALAARFEADKALFKRWGSAVGFAAGAATPHTQLKDPKILSAVRDVVEAVERLVIEGDKSTAAPVNSKPAPPKRSRTIAKVVPNELRRSSMSTLVETSTISDVSSTAETLIGEESETPMSILEALKNGPKRSRTIDSITEDDEKSISMVVPKSGRSRLTKVKWVLAGKGRHLERLTMLDALVDRLYLLIPIQGDGGSSEIREMNSKFEQLRLSMEQDSLMHNENLMWTEKTGREISILLAQLGREEALRWIDAVFTVDHYEAASAARTGGTCDWLLKRPEFTNWANESASAETPKFLWLHGPAGYGKTIISSWIIQHLKQNSATNVAYFFCSSDNAVKRNPLSILRSWIAQVVSTDVDALLEASKMARDKNKRKATQNELWELFRAICDIVPGLVFVVDGFDETIDASSNARLDIEGNRESFLQELVSTISATDCRALLVSRDEADIRSALKRSASSSEEDLVLKVQDYPISNEDVRDDILKYAETLISANLPKKTPKVRTELAVAASEKCDGMFLWVKLLQHRLSRSQWKSPTELMRLVQEMPSELENAYERDMKRIEDSSPEDRERAINILRWILFARRPLTVAELSEALVVQAHEEATCLMTDEIPDSSDEEYIWNGILSLCGTMIEIRSANPGQPMEERTVHLVHFTVKEFLLKPMNLAHHWFDRFQFYNRSVQDEILAMTCLRYLCFDDFSQKFSDVKSVKQMAKRCRFFQYASPCWWGHSELVTGQPASRVQLVERLLDPLKDNWYAWITYSNCLYMDALDEDTTGENEVEKVANEVSEEPVDTTATDEVTKEPNTVYEIAKGASDYICGTALYYASSLGYPDVVKSIIQRANEAAEAAEAPSEGASNSGSQNLPKSVLQKLKQAGDPNRKGGHHIIPLHAAIINGHTEIVSILLASGADPSIKGTAGRAALYLAARDGMLDAVKVLLEHGVDCNVIQENGYTPLSASAFKGNLDISKLLLEYGADVFVIDEYGKTILMHAAWGGSVASVQHLLEAGAELHTIDNNGRNALIWACMDSYEDCVKLLLEKGADSGVRCTGNQTALHMIATRGVVSIGKLLLDSLDSTAAASTTPWDIDVVDDYKFNALYYAAYNGNEDFVKFLLSRGAAVATVTPDKRTALMYACWAGYSSIAKLLLEKGIRDDLDEDGSNALTYAVMSDNEATVNLILESGVDLETADKDQFTALHYACHFKYETSLKCMLSHGRCNLKALDADLDSALHLATGAGSATAVKLLLQHGADVHLKNRLGRIPLHRVRKDTEVETAEILLKAGSDPNAYDHLLTTPLHLACQAWNTAVVTTLVAHGADPHILDIYGLSCLDMAAGLPELYAVLTAGASPDEPAPTPRKSSKDHMRELVSDTCKKIQNSEHTRVTTYYIRLLAQALIYLEDLESAQIAYEQEVKSVSDEGEITFDAYCDICGSGSIKGVRYKCKTCSWADYCEDCGNDRYDKDGWQGCKGHGLLKIPRDIYPTLQRGTVDEKGTSWPEWLETMRIRYSEQTQVTQ